MTDTSQPLELPPIAWRYLSARSDKDYSTAIGLFSPHARVSDDGSDYEGTEQIDGWIRQSSTEFTYTSTPIQVEQQDEDHFAVIVRIQGNFPGGVATLRTSFEIRDQLITRLAIAPV